MSFLCCRRKRKQSIDFLRGPSESGPTEPTMMPETFRHRFQTQLLFLWLERRSHQTVGADLHNCVGSGAQFPKRVVATKITKSRVEPSMISEKQCFTRMAKHVKDTWEKEAIEARSKISQKRPKSGLFEPERLRGHYVVTTRSLRGHYAVTTRTPRGQKELHVRG